MPERDYSHRSLIDKLGVLPEHRVCVMNGVDAAFRMLVTQATREHPKTALRGPFDMIFLQIDAARDLAAIPKAAAHLKPSGSLWIFHPKGKNASVKDGEVRSRYLACGLVDNKVSAYSDTHTATRCVVPRALRVNQ